jgi:hypothetical protein
MRHISLTEATFCKLINRAQDSGRVHHLFLYEICGLWGILTLEIHGRAAHLIWHNICGQWDISTLVNHGRGCPSIPWDISGLWYSNSGDLQGSPIYSMRYMWTVRYFNSGYPWQGSPIYSCMISVDCDIETQAIHGRGHLFLYAIYWLWDILIPVIQDRGHPSIPLWYLWTARYFNSGDPWEGLPIYSYMISVDCEMFQLWWFIARVAHLFLNDISGLWYSNSGYLQGLPICS